MSVAAFLAVFHELQACFRRIKYWSKALLLNPSSTACVNRLCSALSRDAANIAVPIGVLFMGNTSNHHA